MPSQQNLKTVLQNLPQVTGVYIMKSETGKILYVGKAKSLKSRVRSYFNTKNQTLKNQFLVKQIKKIDYIVTANEVEAFLLESSLIKKHKPRYNVRLTDDSDYPYVRCSIQDKFPRLYFERKVKDKKSLYFGPYTWGSSVRNIIDFLNQNFQLRDCSDSDFKTRKRPCLTHQMGFCTAPCVDLVNEKDYKRQFQKTINFLRGQHIGLIKELQKKMKNYSKELRYEEAGRIKNYIQATEMISQSQSVVQESSKDQDIIVAKGDERGTLLEFLHLRQGRLISHRYKFLDKFFPSEENLLSYLNQYYEENIIPDEILTDIEVKKSGFSLLQKVLKQRKGQSIKIKTSQSEDDDLLLEMAWKNANSHFENEMKKGENVKEWLLEIQKKFHLPEIPVRIECYDISHWRGEQTIGSQVVFENAKPLKKDYRLYRLKNSPKENDYASLQEILERRLKHTEYDEPHLILIDGGKGQLKAVQKILKDLNRNEIPIVSLAKDRVQDLYSKTSKYGSSVTSSGERFYLVGRKNPVVFSSGSKSLNLLLQLRDEAHRFAIENHKKRRDKEFLVGDLDSLKGLGVKRKKDLLSHFKSIDKLKHASEEEIAKVPSISKSLAAKIKKHLKA